MKNKQEVLSEVFGYSTFRKGQSDIIDAAIDPSVKGVLVILPTSGGKSLCYQIPSLMYEEGISIVVSPLISLMKDQVDALRKKGVAARFYNSELTSKEKEEILNELNFDVIKILYISPERFDDDDFITVLRNNQINIFAVDEAHAVSMWGHDFRPSYRRLKRAIKVLSPKQVIALTATASSRVQTDICEQLGILEAKKFIYGFFRDNLSIKIKESDGNRLDDVSLQVYDYFNKGITTGIVYTGTRANAEYLSKSLNGEYAVPATFYHAGMKTDERTKVQDDWFEYGGIIIATNSFGMGIDKSDVRFVIHSTMPSDIESWYQEIGRAGRDGNLSVCKMYIDYPQDLRLQNFFINMSCPEPEKVKEFWSWINMEAKKDPYITMTQKEMAKESRIDEENISGCISALRSSGLIKSEKRGVYIIEHQPDGGMHRINIEAIAQKRKLKKDKLYEMKRFTENRNRCRLLQVLDYFGDKSRTEPCGKCDVCSV
jgi:ATP-dependent DNA helicase RecQ